jgi:hypothetical protein
MARVYHVPGEYPLLRARHLARIRRRWWRRALAWFREWLP